MKILRDPKRLSPCVLVLGMFDGVHEGHAQLMRKAARIRAQERAQKAVVAMTFPLLLLILPGVFIVLFAPLIIQYVTR